MSVAGLLNDTHLVMFTRTELSMYLKLARLPRGPTLSFKIENFSLARDVISTIKKQLVFEEAFKHSPLIILNRFSGKGMNFQLLASMFKIYFETYMFSEINLSTVNLSNLRRCICLNYNTVKCRESFINSKKVRKVRKK